MPRLVTQSRTAMRNAPGRRMTHQAPDRRAFSDRDSILPQEMTSSGRPSPKKLKVDSATMAPRRFMTTMKRMAEKKLGNRCRTSTWKNPPPMARAARTYSLCRS